MPRRFYDLSVRSHAGNGTDTVAALAERAASLGFDGIAVTDPAPPETVDVDADITVRPGARLDVDTPGELQERLAAVRDEVDVVAVAGGDATVNRAATEDTRVDVLLHPSRGRTDAGLDHVITAQAGDNGVALGLCMRRLLEATGRDRVHRLRHWRELVRLADAVDAPVVAVSDAAAVEQLRAPRELAAFPRLLGMDLQESFAAVSGTPGRVLARADRVRDGAQVRPGVELVEGDAGGG